MLLNYSTLLSNLLHIIPGCLAHPLWFHPSKNIQKLERPTDTKGRLECLFFR